MSHIEEIKDFVSQVETALVQATNEQSEDVEFLRASKKVVFIAKRMIEVDEDLAPSKIISTIREHLKNAAEQIIAYGATRDKGTFDRFIDHLNDAISSISVLPVLSDAEQKSVTHSFSELTAAKLTELEARVTALNAAQANLIADFRKDWTELIDGNPDKEIAGAKKDLEAEIKKINARIDLSFNGVGDNKGWNVIADEKLSEIDGVKERAKNLGVLIADGTTSGSYREQANAEMWAYRGWRFFTVLIAIVWVCTIFSTPIIAFLKPIVLKKYDIVLDVPVALTGLDLFYTRLMSSLPFIAIAAWASSIASNHRKSAIRFKQFEMDLAAFEPSLENVESIARSAAKLEFVKTTFGKNHDIVDPTTADLLKKVIDKLGDATNKLTEKIKV